MSLAFAVCRRIGFALVCTTTERVTDLLANVARVGELTAETWGELGADLPRNSEEQFDCNGCSATPTGLHSDQLLQPCSKCPYWDRLTVAVAGNDAELVALNPVDGVLEKLSAQS